MLIVALLIMVLAVIAIGYFLWKSPRKLNAADFAFALTPLLVGVLLVGRWPGDPLADAAGIVLMLLGVYSASRLYRGH
ncbi:hypothetical protein V6C03_08765 [Methyloligella sp. 2.7D]|uniref:hypothetical protein n=1 Tax=unclassified Methyloligella TaxID=2625955 RepID=UPI00157E0A30|nr:hypothetical protein [Methyloligella sp. GL2]QKP78041.1 hypothetical protein HT051_11685 [Methyloligella sp. GL2]